MLTQITSQPRRKLLQLFVLHLTALLGAWAITNAAKASDASAFCTPNLVVHDYLAPLSAFPTDQGFKPSGKLRVGPPSLRVFPPRTRLLVIKQDRFEAAGELEGNPRPSTRLRWTAVSHLERISGKGMVVRLVKKKDLRLQTIGKFEGQQFGFGAAVPGGLYRLTVEFRDVQGKHLDKYVEFFRAIRPKSDLRLAVDSSRVVAGETAHFRIKNFGSVDASFNYVARLWNSQGEGVPLEQGKSSLLRPIVKAGHASECVPLKVPMNTSAGKYTLGVRAWDRALRKSILIISSIEVTI